MTREKQQPGSCRQRGDLNGVAEVLQTHDEASGVDGFGPVVEVVRAEIAIELTADQHVVDAGQDRGGERAERLFGAAAHCTRVVLSQGAPLRIRVDRRLPALSSFFGHRPAQEIRCPAVGKRLMSRPISARMISALRTLTPGMVKSAIAPRKGSTSASTSRSISSIAASIASICWRCSRNRKR